MKPKKKKQITVKDRTVNKTTLARNRAKIAQIQAKRLPPAVIPSKTPSAWLGPFTVKGDNELANGS